MQNTYVVIGINGSAAPTPSPGATPGPNPLDTWTFPKRTTAGESYDPRRDNPFIRVADAPMSTFSTDVDTASYAIFRSMVRDGAAIPSDAVRVEEWLNYFRYDDLDQALPAPGEPIAIRTEVTTSPWNPGLQLLRVACVHRRLPRQKCHHASWFSSSMFRAPCRPGQIAVAAAWLALLIEQLRPEDRVAVVVYAGSEGLALPVEPGNERNKISQAIAKLEPGGSTNGAAGIELAYAQARTTFYQGWHQSRHPLYRR